MKEWLKISLILCCFGFFREFRPTDPFFIEYLAGDYADISPDEVNRVYTPIGTYAYLTQIIIIFLITDMFRLNCDSSF